MHDFKTRTTTALIVSYVYDLEEVKHSHLPKYLRRLVDQLSTTRDCWSHVLLLPCVFVIGHALRTSEYVYSTLNLEVIKLEQSIGVTTAGRSYRDAQLDPNDDGRLFDDDGQMIRHHAKHLTSIINDLSTWAIFTVRAPKWDIECVDFLSKLLNESPRLQLHNKTPAGIFRETLEYVRNYASSCLEVAQTSEARLKLELNILYTSIAQDDGQTSARLAASAGKDSTSMKIIALITAAYLPGTFVATLFSMGMFDWQSGDNGAVSSSFWIYWAVAVPLTVMTLFGWAMWWKFEERRFEDTVQRAVHQDRTSKRPPSMPTGLTSHVIGVAEK